VDEKKSFLGENSFCPKKSFLAEQIIFGGTNHFCAKKYFLTEKKNIFGGNIFWPKNKFYAKYIFCSNKYLTEKSFARILNRPTKITNYLLFPNTNNFLK